MIVYERNDHWYARAEGGHRGHDRIPAHILGPFNAKPVPVATWCDDTDTEAGSGHTRYTCFQVEGMSFTLRNYDWSPAYGYSWSEDHETFGDEEPPELGKAFRWAGDRWEPISHPHNGSDAVAARAARVEGAP